MTYPSYPDLCGWNAMLPARSARPSASGNITANYAIVGAGFTGLAVARRLAELDPAADIVVLEATTVGEGSSARNSGFISPSDIAADRSAVEVAKAEAVNRYGAEGFDWLAALIRQYGIDCGLERSGRIKSAATDDGEKSVLASLETVRALGIPHVLLDREQMRERIGTGYYRCGLFTEEGYLVQPAALIRGLADALPANAKLYEGSPVRALRKGVKWRLDTADAGITADHVIMATNAAIKNFGYLRDRLVTIYTYAAITRALAPVDQPKLGSMATWGLFASHRLGTTVRRVGPDRLLIRSLYGYERGIASAKAHDELSTRFRRRYPDLAHVDLEYTWGGTTALTMNGAPFWGQIDERLHAVAGCNGAGVVKGTILGKRLAEAIVGHDVEAGIAHTFGTPTWIAPEPFRSVGFRVVSGLERRKAGLES